MSSDNDIRRVAQEYRDEGYAVVERPTPAQLPAFAVGFTPELLVTRGTRHALVSVKQDRSEFEADANLVRLAEVTNAQPGWQHDFAILRANDPLRRLRRKVGQPTPEQIEAMLSEAERVVELVTPRAAVALAWGGLEAAMRRYAQRVGVRGAGEAETPVLVGELYARGDLSQDDFDQLQDARRRGSVVVHGLAPSEIDAETVHADIALAKRFLTESEKPQPAIAG